MNQLIIQLMMSSNPSQSSELHIRQGIDRTCVSVKKKGKSQTLLWRVLWQCFVLCCLSLLDNRFILQYENIKDFRKRDGIRITLCYTKRGTVDRMEVVRKL